MWCLIGCWSVLSYVISKEFLSDWFLVGFKFLRVSNNQSQTLHGSLKSYVISGEFLGRIPAFSQAIKKIENVKTSALLCQTPPWPFHFINKTCITNLCLEKPAAEKRPSPCVLEIFVNALFHTPAMQRRPPLGHAQC